jgi:Protein of unknown function (DUF3352)
VSGIGVVCAVRSAVVPLAMVAALSGCGSSSSGGDPASVAPAGAIAYFSATVRPTGSLKTGVVDAAREITHLSDPFGDLLRVIEDSSSAQGSGFSYARDIAPWLGSRLGVFADTTGGGSLSHPAYALIIDATNSSKAMGFLKLNLSQDSNGQPVVSRSYRGTTYYTFGSGGEAGGVVKGFAVYGSEAGLREVIDTANGGTALTGTSTYQSSGVAGAPGALADAYVNFGSLVPLIADLGGAEGSLITPSLEKLGLRSFGLTFSANAGSIALDLLTSVSKASGTKTGAAATAVASLPADAWLGLGLGNLGADVARALRELGGSGGQGIGSPLEGLSLSGLDSQLHGLRIERDILPWLGDAAVFVSGSTVRTIGGALVVHSTNPAASKAAVPRILAALRGIRGLAVRKTSVAGADAALIVHLKSLRSPVFVLDGHGIFAVALGASAARQALAPTGALGSSGEYRAASAELGGGLKPTFLLSIPKLAGLILPELPASTAAQVRPYLQAFTVLAVAGTHNGSNDTARIVVGLR